MCVERVTSQGKSLSVWAVEDIAHGELPQVDGSVCVCGGGGGEGYRWMICMGGLCFRLFVCWCA